MSKFEDIKYFGYLPEVAAIQAKNALLEGGVIWVRIEKLTHETSPLYKVEAMETPTEEGNNTVEISAKKLAEILQKTLLKEGTKSIRIHQHAHNLQYKVEVVE